MWSLVSKSNVNQSGILFIKDKVFQFFNVFNNDEAVLSLSIFGFSALFACN